MLTSLSAGDGGAVLCAEVLGCGCSAVACIIGVAGAECARRYSRRLRMIMGCLVESKLITLEGSSARRSDGKRG